MTIQVELSPETEARLKAEAVERGLALETYASHLLQEITASNAPGTGVLSPEEVRQLMSALTEGSEDLPVLPVEATTRASFYEDRF